MIPTSEGLTQLNLYSGDSYELDRLTLQMYNLLDPNKRTLKLEVKELDAKELDVKELEVKELDDRIEEEV